MKASEKENFPSLMHLFFVASSISEATIQELGSSNPTTNTHKSMATVNFRDCIPYSLCPYCMPWEGFLKK